MMAKSIAIRFSQGAVMMVHARSLAVKAATWRLEWLRPLSPIWWGLIVSTGVFFVLWCMSRAGLAILKMRTAACQMGQERAVTTRYFAGVWWDLARASLWSWLSFCVLCEARSGRIGPGMYHGPIYRANGAVVFYLLEAFFFVVCVSLVASAVSSLKRRRAKWRARPELEPKGQMPGSMGRPDTAPRI